ncbi:phosphotransferase [Clostridium gasigenes]|uniref:phosphotransferase family protein n=1 Tax=Clostridium gasigenes TaxID=94869 RepID=UPI001C0D00CF|nr:aminoglycoside phosphotransferase family protein [Clostridium gasigenes]MBU3135480.1 phosphotransferase [Clostridium gasigenes]
MTNEGHRIIGIGATASVYEYGEEKVIKVFNEDIHEAGIIREFDNNRCAYEQGISVPQVFNIIKKDGKTAIVMERVMGESFLKAIMQSPDKCLKLSKKFAEIQYKMHGCKTSRLRTLQEHFTERINCSQDLNNKEKAELQALLMAQKEDYSICHNDFHPDNVIYTESKDTIIDWCDATSGNPWADVARTMLALESTSLPPGIPKEIAIMINLGRGEVKKAYEERYCELAGVKELPIQEWKVIVAASRLSCSNLDEKIVNLKIVHDFL